MRSWNLNYRSKKAKSCSGEDIVKEQGSFASQMTAAKRMDVIAILPFCDGQAAGAVSAKTRVKLEDAPRLLKIPKTECPDVWTRLPRNRWPKSWESIEDPVVPLERNLYGHPLAGLLWEKTVRRSFIRTWMGESSELGMCVLSAKTRVISVSLCGCHQNGRKEAEYGSHVAPPRRRSISASPTAREKRHQSWTRRQCDWWCVACGGQYVWREANSVLTIQASDQLAGEGQLEGIQESSRRNAVAAFFGSSLRWTTTKHQDRVVKLVGPKLNLADFKDAEVQGGPEELILSTGERRGQKAFGQLGSIGTISALLWSFQMEVRCARRCLMEWWIQDGWESMCNTLRKAAKASGHPKDGGVHELAVEVERE